MGSGSPRRRVERSRAEAPGARGGGRRRPAACRAGAGGDLAARDRRAERREGGRDPSPGSRKSARSGGWWYVWFCFQKDSSGFAATFKDLKIWKQALGKRSTENSSSEDGSAEPGAPAEPPRSGARQSTGRGRPVLTAGPQGHPAVFVPGLHSTLASIG